jgi:hypothetical protein
VLVQLLKSLNPNHLLKEMEVHQAMRRKGQTKVMIKMLELIMWPVHAGSLLVPKKRIRKQNL